MQYFIEQEQLKTIHDLEDCLADAEHKYNQLKMDKEADGAETSVSSSSYTRNPWSKCLP